MEKLQKKNLCYDIIALNHRVFEDGKSFKSDGDFHIENNGKLVRGLYCKRTITNRNKK